MSKTILNMITHSKYRYAYLLIILIPSILINIYIYTSTLNFAILLFINFIATFTSLIITLEILIQEEGTKVYNYLRTLRSENYVMYYRTISIFNISSILTLISGILMYIIYFNYINAIQQIIYLILMIICNFFYIYFLQYVVVNINNILVRNIIIIAVTGISMLALMTRNLSTYLMFVTTIGLFFAVTSMNRRLSEELKREKSNHKY